MNGKLDGTQHSDECRERIAVKLSEIGDPRIEREIDKIRSRQELPQTHPEVEEEEEDRMETPEENDEAEPGNDQQEERMYVDELLSLGDLMRIGIGEDFEERFRIRRPKNWKSDVEKMNETLEKEGVQFAIGEIYSPPRMTSVAERMGTPACILSAPPHGRH